MAARAHWNPAIAAVQTASLLVKGGSVRRSIQDCFLCRPVSWHAVTGAYIDV